MDLTDILFSKPFIGSSGGGGSSNVETATIVITVTDGTPEITSGEFPEWCTGANNDYIYGKIILSEAYIGEAECNGVAGIAVVNNQDNKTGIIGGGYISSSPTCPVITTDLSVVREMSDGSFESGTITIDLVYMPEE